LATRWSSAAALRSQVKEGDVVLQSLMQEDRAGAVRSYRCLVLYSTADGNPSGGLATIDVAPARYDSFERLDQGPEVSQAFARLFALASGQHPTYQAMQELGRAQRTIFACRSYVTATCSGRSTRGSTWSSRGTTATV
jgi:hypothetical protein